MRIFLTNDDGIFSPGLAAMARVLRKLGDLLIAAPLTEQSGVSQTITFLTPLTLKAVQRDGIDWGWGIEGTPVDCVKLGIAELCDARPDLIVSGMNNGLNAGANVLYSGTVAAAREGAYLGIPSVAVSLEYAEDPADARIEQAAELALAIIGELIRTPRPGIAMNVNIPFAAVERRLEPQTIRFVPTDTTPLWESYEKRRDPTGRSYFWLSGRPDYHQMHSAATDLGAVTRGEIAVTPLTFDPTCRRTLDTAAALEISPPEIFPLPNDNESEAMNFKLVRFME